jgi:hypothetical protein
MIRVKVTAEDRPYAQDYEAWLMGWVTIDGDQILALVAEGKGDTPWTINVDRIQLWEEV